jgi:hypothetical protein
MFHVLVALIPSLQLEVGLPCQPEWLATFGAALATDGLVGELAVFDDGSGPTLIVAGAFESAGGVEAHSIAAWDGHAWSSLGGGLTGGIGGVTALAVFDDGSGPALFVGGDFLQAGGTPAFRIAKWDGTSWSPLSSGVNGLVYDLTVFDDGSGPALFAAGAFTVAGGAPANHIARWDGATWSALGSGTNDRILSLSPYDEGSGAALYAGGWFTNAGGVPASRVAKWNGLSWSAAGAGVSDPTFAQVNALAVFDDGGGVELYAGGHFTQAGGLAARNVARWNGTSWSALAQGTDNDVWDLTVFDDGGGDALYAGGQFTTAGAITANRIARWNGTSWSALGSGIGGVAPFVYALAAYDDGSGPALYTGGAFETAGGVAGNNLARWSGTSWSPLGSGMNDGVECVAIYDDGSGPALYAGGYFTVAGGLPAGCIAKWNGSSWSPLAGGVADQQFNFPFIKSLAVFDDGSGPALYAGGNFTHAGGLAIKNLARWNGTSWSGVGGGTDKTVSALLVHDDGRGPALYAGGRFDQAGGIPAWVAKWSGLSWSAVGSPFGLSEEILDLTIFDDGSGPALVAAMGSPGPFGSLGGVAKWDGVSWSLLGAEMNGFVFDLATFGPALYAVGDFTTAGGAAKRIAKWNGTSWSALGAGLDAPAYALLVHDDGSGPALYAGGDFSLAGAVLAIGIARWDGSWSALQGGSPGGVRELANFGAGALLAAGGFTVSPGGDSYVALWGCPAIASLPGCAGNAATLEALASSAPLGVPLPLRITGSAAASGLGQVYFGASGLNAGGCGLLVPGIGELLLALTPTPSLVAGGILARGVCDLAPTVPATPALSGVTAHLQGLAIDAALANPIEPTNALAVTLGP